MNNIEFYRQLDEEKVNRLLKRSSVNLASLQQIQELDKKYRSNLQKVEDNQSKLNKISKKIGQYRRENKDIEPIKKETTKLSEEISNLKEQVEKYKKELDQLTLKIPNIPDERVVKGDEEDNEIISENNLEFRPTFNYQPKNHWEIMEKMDLIDSNRATKIAGARFMILKGMAVKLERALINYMLEKHIKTGYQEMRVPFLVNQAAYFGTGQFPKFQEAVYKVENEDKYLISTAEVPLTNIHANEIIKTTDLPIKYCSHTPCFRSESDSAGRDIKGLIRLHQFSKVELFKIVTKEQQESELNELLKSATSILDDLKINYRVVRLAADDLGFSSEMTYDIEVWMPGQNKYREISSCSCFGTFQARRAQIRYRENNEEKAKLAVTLNGSGLAIDRTIAAIIENYQTSDGNFIIPDVLKKYFD